MDLQAWLGMECGKKAVDAFVVAGEQRHKALTAMVAECGRDDMFVDEEAKVFVHARTMSDCPASKEEQIVLPRFELVSDNDESEVAIRLRLRDE